MRVTSLIFQRNLTGVDIGLRRLWLKVERRSLSVYLSAHLVSSRSINRAPCANAEEHITHIKASLHPRNELGSPRHDVLMLKGSRPTSEPNVSLLRSEWKTTPRFRPGLLSYLSTAVNASRDYFACPFTTLVSESTYCYIAYTVADIFVRGEIPTVRTSRLI